MRSVCLLCVCLALINYKIFLFTLLCFKHLPKCIQEWIFKNMHSAWHIVRFFFLSPQAYLFSSGKLSGITFQTPSLKAPLSFLSLLELPD